MKAILITLTTLLFSSISFACSCEYGGNFLYASKFSEIIVKAKVIEHVYHTENGKRFTNYDEFINETINNEFDPFYGTGESIKIEIIELIRGNEERKIIEIFSSDGADCRASTDVFEKGKIYIMSIYQPKRTTSKLPNETNADYAIEGCSENWIEYIPATDQVYGRIKGRSGRKKSKMYPYHKLIENIT